MAKKKTEYYAARSFCDGQHSYGAGSPVPIRKPGEGSECGIRESQIDNLLRTGLLTTNFHAPLEQLSAETEQRTAAEEAKKKAAAEEAKMADDDKAKEKPAPSGGKK